MTTPLALTRTRKKLLETYKIPGEKFSEILWTDLTPFSPLSSVALNQVSLLFAGVYPLGGTFKTFDGKGCSDLISNQVNSLLALGCHKGGLNSRQTPIL